MFREEPQVFLAIPFGTKETTGGEVDFGPVREKIVQTLEALGVSVLGVDVSELPTSLEAIRRSDFVIADVTGHNANVMMEVGLAIGMGKPLLLIAMKRSLEALPFDLAAYQVAVYSPNDLDSVGKYVELMAQDVLAQREAKTTATS